jgi:hypothetical protein
MSKGLEIDYETADRITLLCLKDQRTYLQIELDAYDEGKWLHPEDVVRNQQLIKAIDVLIDYYGG